MVTFNGKSVSPFAGGYQRRQPTDHRGEHHCFSQWYEEVVSDTAQEEYR
jgi:hypothetical protein